MDLKYILSRSLGLIDDSKSFLQYSPKKVSKNSWISFDGGINEFGTSDDQGFYFDNEYPRHQEIIRPFEIQSELVTNGDYLEFIKSNGYKDPSSG